MDSELYASYSPEQASDNIEILSFNILNSKVH